MKFLTCLHGNCFIEFCFYFINRMSSQISLILTMKGFPFYVLRFLYFLHYAVFFFSGFSFSVCFSLFCFFILMSFFFDYWLLCKSEDCEADWSFLCYDAKKFTST